jgi:hypothetical protein
VFLVQFILVSRLERWQGGFCCGPRLFVPLITLLCLPILAGANRQGRWARPLSSASTIAILLGVWINIAGTLPYNGSR